MPLPLQTQQHTSAGARACSAHGAGCAVRGLRPAAVQSLSIMTRRPHATAAATADFSDSAESLPFNEEEGEDTRPAHVAAPVKVNPLATPDWALRSVIKVFTTKVKPSYSLPWQMLPQTSSTGSAFIIDTRQRLILTNAHVVSSATTVYCRRPGSATKWLASVVSVSIPSDLALLTVEADAFWDAQLRALRLAPLPELQAPISVAGFPVGGDSLCLTQGIVSRVSMVRYTACGKLLGVQVDSAINAGNSGGPAFSSIREGLVAGVAFSKNVSMQTDNIGYIIPSPVVETFLAEVRMHGTFRGLAACGFVTQTIENAAQRAYLKMPPEAEGVVVLRVDPSGPAAGHVAAGDVLTAVDGVPVAGDGTVPLRHEERVDFSHLIRSRQIGDELSVSLLRGGQELCVCFSLIKLAPLVGLVDGYDCSPQYLVVGGLVFSYLSLPLLDAVYGLRRGWRSQAPVEAMSAISRFKERPGDQVVVLVQVLAHSVNQGYKGTMLVAQELNSVPIRNLAHLAAMVDEATAAATTQGSDQHFLHFLFEGGQFMVLDTLEVVEAMPQVLRANGIPRDRSTELVAPLQGA